MEEKHTSTQTPETTPKHSNAEKLPIQEQETKKPEPKEETQEAQEKLRKKQDKLNKELRSGKTRKEIGESRSKRKEKIRKHIEEYKEDLAELISLVGKDKKHPAHALVADLKISAEFLVADENIELAKVLGDILARPERYMDEASPERTIGNFFFKALETANRGGHSPQAITLRRRMAQYIAQMCEKDEGLAERLRKTVEVIKSEKLDSGGVELELAISPVVEKHGKEGEGDLRYKDLEEFEGGLEKGENIESLLNKLLIKKPMEQEIERLTRNAKKHAKSSDERNTLVEQLRKIIRNPQMNIVDEEMFTSQEIEAMLGELLHDIYPESGMMPPRQPTQERKQYTADQLRSELQLRTLTNQEIERIFYGGEEVAEEFVFDLILQAGANPKGRFEFDLSKMYQMSEVEKILRFKETERIGEETRGEILASRFASNIEDYRNFHTANQLVFYASTSLEDQLKILTKVLTPEHLDVLKDVDYGPEALQLYERMLYQILADKLIEYQRIEEKAKRSMSDENAPSLTDEEYRILQRGAIIEPEDLIPSSPGWNKLYRRDRAFKMLSIDFDIVVETAARPANQRNIDEKEAERKRAYEKLREAQTSGSDRERDRAFERYKRAVKDAEMERSKDIEREQAEHDLAFIKEMRKEYASQVKEEMRKDRNIDENEALRRAVALSDQERREFEAGAFFSEREAKIRSLLMVQARVDLEREYARGGLHGKDLDRKVKGAIAREDYKIRRALFHARTFYITTVRLPSINANVGIMPPPVSELALAAPTQEDLLRVLNYEAFMLHRFDYFGQDYTKNLSHVLLVLRFQKIARDLKIDETNEWKKALKMRAETTEEVESKAEAMQKILQEKTGIDYTMLVRGHLTPIGGLFDDTGWRLGLSVLNKLRELVGLEESQKFAQGTRLINLGDEISNELMSINRRTIEEMKKSDRVEDRARAKIYEEYIKVRYSSDSKEKKRADELRKKLVDGFKYKERRRVKTSHSIMGIEAEKKQEIFRTIAERTPSFIINFFPRQAQSIIRNRLESNLGGSWENNSKVWKQFEKALVLAESEATNRLIDDINFKDLIIPYLKHIASIEGAELMNHQQFVACVEALEEIRGYFSQNGTGRENLEHLANFNFPLTLLLYDVPWKHVKFTEMGAGAAIDRRLGREIPAASKGNHSQGDMLTDPSPIEIDKLKERVVEYVGAITGYKGRDAELLGDMLQRLALDFNIHRYRRSYGWIPGWERAAVWYTWTENSVVEKIKSSKVLGPLVSKLLPSPSKAVEYFGKYAPAWMEGEVKWYTEGIKRAGAWAKHRRIPYDVQKDFKALTPDIILAFGREAMPKIMLLMMLLAIADALRDKN